MNLAVWIVSGLLAIGIAGGGVTMLALPRVKLVERMPWAATWRDTNIKLLGLAQVMGAVGVIVPAATGIMPVLAPIAASCLGILMVGAIKTHLDRKEPFAPPAVFLAFALFVAVSRFGLLDR